MTADHKQPKRSYSAPARDAAAQRTRASILDAAKQLFEQNGWAGTTLRAVAAKAGVSQKTVEAVYRTKPGLLQATVDYAMRGDAEATPMPQRPAIAEMEAAPDARTMLELHATHLRRVIERSAGIAWTLEHAAAGGGEPAELWAKMAHNRAYAVGWATETLLAKPDAAHLTAAEAERVFWIAIDWGTYRTLTRHAGLTNAQYEQWLLTYYERTLLTGPG